MSKMYYASLGLLLLAVATAAWAAEPKSNEATIREAWKHLIQTEPGDWSFSWTPRSKLPHTIRCSGQGRSFGSDPVSAAKSFLEQHGGLFLRGKRNEGTVDFVHVKDYPGGSQSKGLRRAVQFQQTHNGVPVQRKWLWIKVTADGHIERVSACAWTPAPVDMSMGVSLAEFETIAKNYLAKLTQYEVTASPELLISLEEKTPRLCYYFGYRTWDQDGRRSSRRVWFAAKTGELVKDERVRLIRVH